MAMLIRSKKVIAYRDEENKRPLVEFEFTCDSTSDLPTSPLVSGEEIAQGSLAWVVADADYYGYMSTGEWVNQTGGSD